MINIERYTNRCFGVCTHTCISIYIYTYTYTHKRHTGFCLLGIKKGVLLLPQKRRLKSTRNRNRVSFHGWEKLFPFTTIKLTLFFFFFLEIHVNLMIMAGREGKDTHR